MNLDILDPTVLFEFPTEHPMENEGLTSFWSILAKETEGIKLQPDVLVK